MKKRMGTWHCSEKKSSYINEPKFFFLLVNTMCACTERTRVFECIRIVFTFPRHNDYPPLLKYNHRRSFVRPTALEDIDTPAQWWSELCRAIHLQINFPASSSNWIWRCCFVFNDLTFNRSFPRGRRSVHADRTSTPWTTSLKPDTEPSRYIVSIRIKHERVERLPRLKLVFVMTESFCPRSIRWPCSRSKHYAHRVPTD